MNDEQILELVKELPPLQVLGLTHDQRGIEVSLLYTNDLSRDRMVDLLGKLRMLFEMLENNK